MGVVDECGFDFHYVSIERTVHSFQASCLKAAVDVA
jgi:hypothetical protein